jgi:hypothetical protein
MKTDGKVYLKKRQEMIGTGMIINGCQTNSDIVPCRAHLIGSVSEYCVANAACPVTVVKPKSYSK